jgi:hypothetical protein
MLWTLQRNEHGFWVDGAQPSALPLTDQPSTKLSKGSHIPTVNFTERVPLFFLWFIPQMTSSREVTSNLASPLFVEPETSLPFSHGLVTDPYLAPYKYSPYPPTHILHILFNTIINPSLGLQIDLFPSGFPTKTTYAIGPYNTGLRHSASHRWRFAARRFMVSLCPNSCHSK